MRPAILAFALVASAFPALCAAQRVLPWGGAEIIGLQKIKREAVLEKLDFKVGEPVKQSEKEMLRWCNALRTLPLAAINCSGAEVDGKVYYIVEIVESATADLGFKRMNGAPALGSVPPEARKLLARREYRVQEMGAEGSTPTERVTPSGILVAEDPELRSFDAQLREMVAGQQEKYVEIAQDPNHRARREAIQLLAWTGSPQASLSALHPCLLDPDVAIRNEMGRLVLLFGDRVQDTDLAEAIVASLAQALMLPSHPDRTRSVLGLAQIYAKHRELKARILALAGDALRKVAAESIIPNVGGEARSLLAALGDVPPRKTGD